MLSNNSTSTNPESSAVRRGDQIGQSSRRAQLHRFPPDENRTSNANYFLAIPHSCVLWGICPHQSRFLPNLRRNTRYPPSSSHFITQIKKIVSLSFSLSLPPDLGTSCAIMCIHVDRVIELIREVSAHNGKRVSIIWCVFHCIAWNHYKSVLYTWLSQKMIRRRASPFRALLYPWRSDRWWSTELSSTCLYLLRFNVLRFENIFHYWWIKSVTNLGTECHNQRSSLHRCNGRHEDDKLVPERRVQWAMQFWTYNVRKTNPLILA